MTAQIPDTLTIFGRNVNAGDFIPLGDDPALIEVTPEEARKSLRLVHTTACWRGYRAHWQLAEDSLLLVGVDGGLRLIDDQPLLARWLSGKLALPIENSSTSVSGWVGAPYVDRVSVTIERGLILNVDRLDWLQRVDEWVPRDNRFERRRVSWAH